MCSRDLQALDMAALDRELATDKHNAFARTIARQQLSRTKMRGADFAAKVRELAAKDAAFEQLAYKVPSAAWDRALARYRSNAAPLARSAAFETVFYGPSKKASRGCSTPLRDDFRAYVRSAKPRDLAAVDALATDDIGVLLLSRLAACEALDGSGHAAVMLYTLGNAARTARGPRLAVYHALVDALSEIRADRERFPLEVRDLPSMPPMEIWSDVYKLASGSVLAMQKAAGVVKKVTTVEDGVIVDFATEAWTEDDWNCVDTNKVFKIDAGRVIYHQSCKKVGKRTVKRTAPSIWIPSAYAAAVRAGAFVDFEYDMNKKHDKAIAMPRVVFKNKQRTALLAAYGIDL
jgi:ribosomal protein L37AE/L43A